MTVQHPSSPSAWTTFINLARVSGYIVEELPEDTFAVNPEPEEEIKHVPGDER